MEAIKEIKKIDSNEIVIKIPESFKHRKVEIIILPLEDEENAGDRFMEFVNDPIKIKNFTMLTREERNAR